MLLADGTLRPIVTALNLSQQVFRLSALEAVPDHRELSHRILYTLNLLPMRHLSLIFTAGLTCVLLGACKPAPQPNVVPAQIVEVAAPLHPEIELYINNYVLGPNQGSTTRPNLSQWSPDVKTKFSTTTNQEGKPPYSASLEYLGRKPEGDFYNITISFPAAGTIKTASHELVYSGGAVELLRDSEYRIGIRPKTAE